MFPEFMIPEPMLEGPFEEAEALPAAVFLMAEAVPFCCVPPLLPEPLFPSKFDIKISSRLPEPGAPAAEEDEESCWWCDDDLLGLAELRAGKSSFVGGLELDFDWERPADITVEKEGF